MLFLPVLKAIASSGTF